jgi:hypothetical protein
MNQEKDKENCSPVDETSIGMTNAISEFFVKDKEISLTDYDLRIRFLSYGCIVSIGCKEIAFSSIEDAMSEINFYIKNPVAAKKVWSEKFLK